MLIRATYADKMASIALRNLNMDTAVPENTGQEVARMVENCQCPEGYTGTSCEVRCFLFLHETHFAMFGL